MGRWFDQQRKYREAEVKASRTQTSQKRGDNANDLLRKLAAFRLSKAVGENVRTLIEHYGTQDSTGDPLALPYRSVADFDGATREFEAFLKGHIALTEHLISERTGNLVGGR